MEIRILGPLEVRDGDSVVKLGGGRQRALLADLAIHRGQPLSADRLIDDLWGERPPATAAKTLQVLVSRLRKALGRETIVTYGAGYALADDGITTDVELLERALRDDAHEALALFRGRPLAEFAYEDFAQTEIVRLDELRLMALEERFRHDLDGGRHADVVPELEGLVRDHPLRERFRAQLMLALYRSGRQADALDVYKSARTALVDELGLEPGHELRELHHAMLRQEPSLGAPAPSGAAPEPSRGPFVGREPELAELVAGLDRAVAGVGSLFLVTGEPGIGKSRLADEVGARARARGARVLVGRCWEAGGAPAYWPWLQALRSYIRDVDAETLRAQLGGGASYVAQILPDVRELFPELPDLPPLDADAARFRLFEATTSLLRAAAADVPVVLVLDDLHAADTPSLLLLQFLARELADSRLLVVAASRDVDPVPGETMLAALTDLSREHVTHRLELGGLSEAEIAAFVAATATEVASPDVVHALNEQTEGNPLFLGETVRLLSVERGGTSTIPDTVRDVIERRLAHLSDRCNRVLEAASVVGREFDVAVLERLAEVSGATVLDALDEAIAARVVAPRADAAARIRFAHVLIRDTLYARLATAQRADLHRRVVDALEEQYARDRETHLAELAQHAIGGRDFERALDLAQRAAARALTLLAFEERARLYRLALDALDVARPRDDRARVDILLGLGEAEQRAGNDRKAKDAFLEAARVAERSGLGSELARAALGYGGRSIAARAGADPHLLTLLQSGIAAAPADDVELRTRLMARLAGGLRDEPSRERRDKVSREALDLARESGNATALVHALDGRSMAILAPDTMTEYLALADEQCDVAARIGDEERLFHGEEHRVIAYMAYGKFDEAAASLEVMHGIAERLKQPIQVWHVAAARALFALALGRLDEAEELVPAALEIGQRAQPDMALPVHALQRHALADFRGGVDETEQELQELASRYPSRALFRCVLAHVAARQGAASASRLLDELSADDFSAVAFEQEWLFALSFVAEACALLGDARRAARLYDLLLPWSALTTWDYQEGFRGSTERYLALLAATAARPDDARRHFEAAIAANERMGARVWLALTQIDYAELLLSRGDERDAARAGGLLDAALATCDELDLKPHAARAAELQSSVEIVGPSPSGS